MALTGKFDFRRTWSGKLILYVEEEVKLLFRRKLKRRWRRAKLIDMAEPELRRLMDMRFQPRPTYSSVTQRPAFTSDAVGGPSTATIQSPTSDKGIETTMH